MRFSSSLVLWAISTPLALSAPITPTEQNGLDASKPPKHRYPDETLRVNPPPAVAEVADGSASAAEVVRRQGVGEDYPVDLEFICAGYPEVDELEECRQLREARLKDPDFPEEQIDWESFCAGYPEIGDPDDFGLPEFEVCRRLREARRKAHELAEEAHLDVHDDPSTISERDEPRLLPLPKRITINDLAVQNGWSKSQIRKVRKEWLEFGLQCNILVLSHGVDTPDVCWNAFLQVLEKKGLLANGGHPADSKIAERDVPALPSPPSDGAPVSDDTSKILRRQWMRIGQQSGEGCGNWTDMEGEEREIPHYICDEMKGVRHDHDILPSSKYTGGVSGPDAQPNKREEVVTDSTSDDRSEIPPPAPKPWNEIFRHDIDDCGNWTDGEGKQHVIPAKICKRLNRFYGNLHYPYVGCEDFFCHHRHWTDIEPVAQSSSNIAERGEDFPPFPVPIHPADDPEILPPENATEILRHERNHCGNWTDLDGEKHAIPSGYCRKLNFIKVHKDYPPVPEPYPITHPSPEPSWPDADPDCDPMIGDCKPLPWVHELAKARANEQS